MLQIKLQVNILVTCYRLISVIAKYSQHVTDKVTDKYTHNTLQVISVIAKYPHHVTDKVTGKYTRNMLQDNIRYC